MGKNARRREGHGPAGTTAGSQGKGTWGMAEEQTKRGRGFSNAYEMFVLVLTILSLVIMVLLVVPLSEATKDLLTVYDNLICVVFLIDFGLRMRRAPSTKQYFIHERGWLDLLGSIPSFAAFRYAGLFRLARLSRLGRAIRMLSGQKRKEIIADVLANRGQYAAFVTILAAVIVLVAASISVLAFETAAEGGNITSGGDALWWSIVTLTTVGYGDAFPMTAGGRITAVFVMFGGVGIIGALASILASFLVAPSEPEPETQAAAAPGQAAAGQSDPVQDELRAIRAELEALRKTLGVGGQT